MANGLIPFLCVSPACVKSLLNSRSEGSRGEGEAEKEKKKELSADPYRDVGVSRGDVDGGGAPRDVHRRRSRPGME